MIKKPKTIAERHPAWCPTSWTTPKPCPITEQGGEHWCSRERRHPGRCECWCDELNPPQPHEHFTAE